MPVFVPDAVIMAVQPVQQHYTFHGFTAPIVQFQEGSLAWGYLTPPDDVKSEHVRLTQRSERASGRRS